MNQWRQEARRRLERLYAVSQNAAEEAIEQAGLPEAFAWDLAPLPKLKALCIACRIRLEEAGAW